MSSGGRVSIPSSVRKTILNIKEITGSHSEEEVYAMLKECSMDPNETAQKLLLQDTFHEVKRKRYRRKENLNKESAESRWKPALLGQGTRVGRGNYSTRYVSPDFPGLSDAGGGKNSARGKENGINHVSELGQLPLLTFRVTENKERNPIASSLSVIAKGPTDVASRSAKVVRTTHSLTRSVAADISATRHEMGSQQSPHQQISVTDSDSKSTFAASEGSSFMQEKMASKSSGVVNFLVTESSQAASSIFGSSFSSRPLSNYSSWSQVIGPQKAGPSKEWKPKSRNPNLAQGSRLSVSSEVPTALVDTNTQSQPILNVLDSKEATSVLQRKLAETHLSDAQHVVIPDHLYVPETEKLGFCFGSFDASFALSTSHSSGPENDTSPGPLSETSEEIEETLEEQSLSNQNSLVTADEGAYVDDPQSSLHVPENLSSAELYVSSNVVPKYESKQEITLHPEGQQYSVVHTSPSYGFGFVPPMLGSQVAPLESTESQGRDVSQLPNFIVQQPFDPESYYAQFYRSGADSDGRISPFHSAGFANKYNGNVAVLTPQISHTSQEVGNPLLLSMPSPTPLVTQAAGVLQSTMGVAQQPLPVFRQPYGMHLPHYPPNYFPYGHYFSPFYVSPLAIHQFLSNGSFPQQSQAGGVYPAPAAATVKYSFSQYKPGTNTGNSTHVGLPGSYRPYGSSSVGYNPSSAVISGNSNSNEDLAASQFKESNVYITGRQSEGPAVWISAPGREISGLPASSLYNFPQGQMAFTPTQAGHGPLAGIYHAAQPVTTAPVHPLLQQSQTIAGAVDIVGPTGSVYQQPQHAQINWSSSF